MEPSLRYEIEEMSDHEVASDDEIRQILERAPQRRGVEVNLNRSVEPLRDENVENARPPAKPRRNRLSKPLGVMATESLQFQIQQNALLTDILHELRYTNRR